MKLKGLGRGLDGLWVGDVGRGLDEVVPVVLAGLRIVGAGDDARFRAERFDSKQVTIWPEGTPLPE